MCLMTCVCYILFVAGNLLSPFALARTAACNQLLIGSACRGVAVGVLP